MHWQWISMKVINSLLCDISCVSLELVDILFILKGVLNHLEFYLDTMSGAEKFSPQPRIPYKIKKTMFVHLYLVIWYDFGKPALLFSLLIFWGGHQGHLFKLILGGKEMYLSRASVQIEHRIWNWFVDFIFISLFIINPTFSNI